MSDSSDAASLPASLGQFTSFSVGSFNPPAKPRRRLIRVVPPHTQKLEALNAAAAKLAVTSLQSGRPPGALDTPGPQPLPPPGPSEQHEDSHSSSAGRRLVFEWPEAKPQQQRSLPQGGAPPPQLRRSRGYWPQWQLPPVEPLATAAASPQTASSSDLHARDLWESINYRGPAAGQPQHASPPQPADSLYDSAGSLHGLLSQLESSQAPDRTGRRAARQPGGLRAAFHSLAVSASSSLPFGGSGSGSGSSTADSLAAADESGARGAAGRSSVDGGRATGGSAAAAASPARRGTKLAAALAMGPPPRPKPKLHKAAPAAALAALPHRDYSDDVEQAPTKQQRAELQSQADPPVQQEPAASLAQALPSSQELQVRSRSSLCLNNARLQRRGLGQPLCTLTQPGGRAHATPSVPGIR